MLAGWVCVLIRSDLGELIQAVPRLLGPHAPMVGAEFVPFPEVLRPHAIVGASLSFCHLLGPPELSFCQWCGPGDDFLPTLLWEEQVAVAAGSP